MKNYVPHLAMIGALAFSSAAFAADEYTLDPAHTWVSFAIDQQGFANVHGKFGDVAGTIMFDEADPSGSSVEVVIKAASIDTNHEARNGHLVSPDFFNAAEFPDLTFTSTSIEITGENTGTITGDLTMTGVTQAVTLDTVFNKSDGGKIGFSATAEITPGDFGMSKVAGFGLGPTVQITLDVQAKK